MAVVNINFWVFALGLNTMYIKAADMGGSIVVHTFGAYFGIGCSIYLTRPSHVKKWASLEEGNYTT